jgi:hypothetical protein
MPYRDPEKAREASRRWRAAHLEAVRQHDRERYAADPEKKNELVRRYRQANPEKRRERERRWRAANPEKASGGWRRWRAADPEKAREYQHRYWEANGRTGWLRRNHGLRPEGWMALLIAQDGCCYLCGDPLPDDPRNVHIDHDHRCCDREHSCRSCRRGLAHSQCNTLIGLAGDDPARLHRIASNLAKAQRRIGKLPKPLTLFDLEEPDEQ